MDFETVARFLRDIESIGDAAEFPGRAVAAIDRLIPSDVSAYNEVHPRERRLLVVARPADVVDTPEHRALERHLHQHPIIAHVARTGDRRALKISDFLSRAEFHRLEIYQDCFRAIGTEEQMAISLPAEDGVVIGLALNRSRPSFSEDERRLLDLVAPHVAYVHETVRLRARLDAVIAGLERGVGHAGAGVVLLDRGGRAIQATDLAVRWLQRHLGCPVRPGHPLPPPLDGWVLEQQTSTPSTAREIVLRRGPGRLVVRFLPRSEGGGLDTLVLREAVPAPVGAAGPLTAWEAVPGPNCPFGPLTGREAEVLAAMAQGATDGEIAAALALSRRTVQKHVEHILTKLQVHTRTAAAARWLAGLLPDEVPPSSGV